ncbi:hypothetical protein Q4485_10030 [Granulosicoccaceae sp. 1_MG-2023]|nr:hypothetical protein [Granulosicoccaceae sp. 1_MG-2023]
MQILFQRFLQIALFRAGPQDLPAGNRPPVVAVLAALLAYMLSGLGVQAVGPALAQFGVDLLVTALFLYGGLQFQKRTARFAQAFAALMGSSAVINLAAVPVWLGMNDQISAAGSLFLLLLLGWSMAVCAHVFRHTFELSAAAAAVVAVCYLVTSMAVSSALPFNGVSTGEAPAAVQYGEEFH